MGLTTRDLFKSKFFSASDIATPTDLTVKDVASELVGPTRDLKGVMQFVEDERRLILNKTNFLTIAAAFGDDTDRWRGCRIRLVKGRALYQGKPVGALRVAIPPTPTARPAAASGFVDDGRDETDIGPDTEPDTEGDDSE